MCFHHFGALKLAPDRAYLAILVLKVSKLGDYPSDSSAFGNRSFKIQTGAVETLGKLILTPKVLAKLAS